MRIASRINFRQGGYSKYNGMLPVGATLGDELGGVGYIGVDGINTLDNTTQIIGGNIPQPDYSKMMNPYPLPLSDENGNIVVGTGIPTPISSVGSVGETNNKENNNIPQERRVTDVFGIPTKKFNIAIGILVIVGGYFLYKGVIKKALIK